MRLSGHRPPSTTTNYGLLASCDPRRSFTSDQVCNVNFKRAKMNSCSIRARLEFENINEGRVERKKTHQSWEWLSENAEPALGFQFCRCWLSLNTLQTTFARGGFGGSKSLEKAKPNTAFVFLLKKWARMLRFNGNRLTCNKNNKTRAKKPCNALADINLWNSDRKILWNSIVRILKPLSCHYYL